METKSLRNLYFTRTVVQLFWAAAVIGLAAAKPELGVILMVLYPLWDVACTLYDVKKSGGAEPAALKYVNAAAGALTAVAIGVTGFAHPQNAVVIFGVWALAAGLLQLGVGVARRQRMGGQWAMILSGAQSTLAGVAFVLGGLSGKRHVHDVGGYAVFGAVYFLIAGILLGRKKG